MGIQASAGPTDRGRQKQRIHRSAATVAGAGIGPLHPPIGATGCQNAIAKEIIEADADHVLALKGNQETVRGAEELPRPSKKHAGLATPRPA
jgi:hypothetical protein